MIKPQSTHTLAIDLSEHSIKVVQRERDSNRIDLVHAEPLAPEGLQSEAYLTRLFRNLVRSYRSTLRTRDAVICVPSVFTFVRVMNLDPRDEDLAEQIPWEIEQQSLGPAGKLYVDWIPLPSPAGDPGPSGDGRCLVAASGEIHLNGILSALRKARLNPRICDVDVFALANLFFHSYPGEAGNLTALANLSGDRALLCAVKDGAYLDSENVVGLNFGTPEAAVESVQNVEQHLKAVLARCPVSSDIGVRLYLSGEYLMQGALSETLLSAFTFKCEVMDPLKNLAVAENLKSQFGPYAPAFAVAAGLSLRAPEGALP